LVKGNWNPDCWGRIENSKGEPDCWGRFGREILTVGAGLGESSVSNCSFGSKVDEAVINSVKREVGWWVGWWDCGCSVVNTTFGAYVVSKWNPDCWGRIPILTVGAGHLTVGAGF
jgi:hypothetical protein